MVKAADLPDPAHDLAIVVSLLFFRRTRSSDSTPLIWELFQRRSTTSEMSIILPEIQSVGRLSERAVREI